MEKSLFWTVSLIIYFSVFFCFSCFEKFILYLMRSLYLIKHGITLLIYWIRSCLNSYLCVLLEYVNCWTYTTQKNKPCYYINIYFLWISIMMFVSIIENIFILLFSLNFLLNYFIYEDLKQQNTINRNISCSLITE